MAISVLAATLVPLVLGVVLWALRPFVARHEPSESSFALMGPLFIFSRRPVIVALTLTGAAAAVWIARTAARRGHTSFEDGLRIGALAIPGGGGFGLIVVGIVFVALAMTKKPPGLQLLPGETALYDRAANHYFRGEARGGRLAVTTRRLFFSPHRFNVQLEPWSQPLGQVTKLEALDERILAISQDEARTLLVVSARGLLTFVRELATRTEAQRADESAALVKLAGL